MTGSDSHKQAWGLGQQVTGTNLGTPAATPKPAPRTRTKAAAKPNPNPYLEADQRNARPPKNVRVTLNMPPGLYRQLRKWTDAAADELGASRVSQQDAIRAMIDVTTRDRSIAVTVIDWLRQDQP